LKQAAGRLCDSVAQARAGIVEQEAADRLAARNPPTYEQSVFGDENDEQRVAWRR
jgi:hypothetical protein